MKIPVVLASDNNHAALMYITMLSAIKNMAEDSFYDFYLLVSENFSEKNKKRLLKLQADRVNINFICMQNEFQDLQMKISHITCPTYYRLKMADLVPFDKVIYLDTDVVVLKDLCRLYNTDLKDNFIAGVKAAECIMERKNNGKYYSDIGLDDTSQYINAGVTLWNLKKIREENITPELLKLSQKNFGGMDQDVINVAFYDKILHLDFCYNVMTKYVTGDKTKFYDIYGENSYLDGLEHPYIIHYAGTEKPWTNIFCSYSQFWWRYAFGAPVLMGHTYYFTYVFGNIKKIYKVFKYVMEW